MKVIHRSPVSAKSLASRVLAVALGAVALSSATAMAAPSYNTLGFFADGFAIADNGTVVGELSGSLFLWNPSTPDILNFIGGNGASAGLGHGGQPDISADGTRVSGNFNNAAGTSELAIYDVATGAWTPLGNIGGSSGVEASSSWGMSRNGQHIAGLGWVNGGTAHGITWSQSTGVVTDIGSTVAGNSSRANAISNDGSVVVGWQDGELGRQAAIWVNGVQRLLTLPGEPTIPLGEASAVTPDGRYVTGAGYTYFNWIYDTQLDIVTNLGALGPTDDPFSPLFTGGTDWADDGKSFVGYERIFGFGPGAYARGYIWLEGQGLLDLTDFALAAGVPLPDGVVLSLPLGISSDGQTITGRDSNFNGFVITIPEPAGLGLLALAVPMLSRRRR